MEKGKISRGDFIRKGGLALVTVSGVGCLLGCMTKNDSDSAAGKGFTGPRTLSAAEKSTLDTQGFLNLEGVIVVKDGAAYRAFTRICPHEAGDVFAQSATSLQCQRHTDQFYNKFGQGNGARTTATLTTYTVTDNAGTLTITA